jgi:hypothetical protein
MVYGNVLDIGTPSDATVTNAKTNFVSTSSAAGLQIKGDGTTDGTLQLNCSQNSHGVKIKSPAHSASASYTLTLPTTDGSADEFLKTDGSGVLSWATAGGGDLVKLGTVSTNNSNVSALTIDNCFTTTYDLYRIIGFHNHTSGGSHQYFRWRTGGASGSTYTTSDYTWINRGHYLLNNNSAGEYINKNGGSDHGRVASDVRSDSNSAFVSFDLLVADPLTTLMSRSHVTGTSTVRQNTDQRFVAHYVGITNQSNVNATGFQMTVSTGNISYGRVSVYGYKQA